MHCCFSAIGLNASRDQIYFSPQTHLELGLCLAVTTEEEMCFIIMKSYHRALKLQTVTFSRQAACEEFFPAQIFEIFEGL